MKRFSAAALLCLLLNTALSAMGGAQNDPDFSIGEFHSLRVDIPCTMTLIRGSDFEMDIRDPEGRAGELDIYNDRGTLVFAVKERNILRLLRKEDLHISLTLPEWEKISLSSSGEIRSRDSWSNGEIAIKTSASGSIYLEAIEAREGEIRLSASGDVRIGTLRMEGPLEVSVSGSGDMGIDTLSCASLRLKNSAAGEIRLAAVDAAMGSVEIRLSGSGDALFESIEARNLSLESRSSGSIEGGLRSDSLELKLSGSGDAILRGRTGIASLRSSGSGTIDLAAMEINQASLSGSGSGDMILKRGTVIREAEFSGSGKLITR